MALKQIGRYLNYLNFNKPVQGCFWSCTNRYNNNFHHHPLQSPPTRHNFSYTTTNIVSSGLTTSYNTDTAKRSFTNKRQFSAKMGPSYKLHYFNVRARAEPARFLFAVAGVPYEDIRIDRAEWPAKKETFPWGKVPVLEVDGERIAESSAICRYLAKQFKLTGANDLQAAKCDEYVDVMMDCRNHWRAFHFESDEEKKAVLKKAFLETHVPYYFQKFENILEKSGGDFLLGKTFTWADLHIGHTLEFFEDTVDPEILKNYPHLKKFKDAVFNIPQIKKWVGERPKTNM